MAATNPENNHVLYKTLVSTTNPSQPSTTFRNFLALQLLKGVDLNPLPQSLHQGPNPPPEICLKISSGPMPTQLSSSLNSVLKPYNNRLNRGHRKRCNSKWLNKGHPLNLKRGRPNPNLSN